MILALAGNQNCGKTTLFNQLTGSNQHVGNFPGVTVEQKSGFLRGDNRVQVVDLPGLYSLRPYSSEEIVTRDFLLSDKTDAIINIIDATNIERNLYLTLQLIELDKPMVLALNMMDEVQGNGGSIDIPLLSDKLGIPVVPISAAKRTGLDELVEKALNAANLKKRPRHPGLGSGAVEHCMQTIDRCIGSRADAVGIPRRFAAAKLVEDDPLIAGALGLSEDQQTAVALAVSQLEQELHTDQNAALADMRYHFIEELCAKAVVKMHQSKEHLRSMSIDRLLTHRYFAIPVFLLVMLGTFALTFGVIGNGLSDLLSTGIDSLTDKVDAALLAYGLNPVLHSLIIQGVFTGVGSVLSFLPIIVTLFFFLAILEDTGYMARIAFILDKPMRKIGLSGRSFVPMLMGFGCTVPAVLATRTLSSDRDRKMTILLTPFMSCSAKLPIYAVFTAAFFRQHQALVMLLLYLMGVGVGILCGLVLKSTKYQGDSVPFIMELPNYRLPSLKSVWLLMWDKARDFLVRAFTVILGATLIIWFLETFNYQFNMVEDSSHSLLGTLGMAISPLFVPLGFQDWRITTALITGFTAKEAVVSTLAVLTGSSIADLGPVLDSMFTPLTAFSFLTFTLLYTPCVAAVTAIAREMGSALSALKIVLLQCGIAWTAAALVYQIGRLFIQ